MGILSALFGKQKPRVNITIETSATVGQSYISDKDLKRLQSGWKQDANGIIYPPDTVWVRPGSKVYHHLDFCPGSCNSCDSVKPMSEKEAIKRGLRPCSKCDWDYNPFV